MKNLLSKPIFPTGFSGRYLTKEGAFSVPSLMNNGAASTVSAGETGAIDPAKSAVEMAKKEIVKLKKLKASNPVVRAGKDDERTKARKKAKQKAKDERKKRNRELKGGGAKAKGEGEGGGGGGGGKGDLMDDGFPKPTFTFE